MRDAFGGSFMIKLLLVFIIIYVGFTAIALNYAKAFKVKNKVIEYIEDNELIVDSLNAADFAKMEEYFQTDILAGMNYKGQISCPTEKEYYQYGVLMKKIYCQDGILIEKTVYGKGTGNKYGDYYTITTAFGWDIPVFNSLLAMGNQDGGAMIGNWTISGETRAIYKE